MNKKILAVSFTLLLIAGTIIPVVNSIKEESKKIITDNKNEEKKQLISYNTDKNSCTTNCFKQVNHLIKIDEYNIITSPTKRLHTKIGLLKGVGLDNHGITEKKKYDKDNIKICEVEETPSISVKFHLMEDDEIIDVNLNNNQIYWPEGAEGYIIVWANCSPAGCPVCLWYQSYMFPTGVEISPQSPIQGYNSVSCRLDWKPSYCQAGMYDFVFYYSNNCGMNPTEHHIPIIVTNVNRKPLIELDPPGPLVVGTGNKITIDVIAHDEDVDECGWLDDPLTLGCSDEKHFQWEQNIGLFEWTTTLADAGKHVVVFDVKDSYGGTDQEEVIIEIEEYFFIDLDATIFDGLNEAGQNANGGGGNKVPGTKEDTEGAFTVINMDDSDADGIIDCDDTDGVTAKRGTGIHEKEIGDPNLMKLVLEIENPKGGKATLTKSGDNKNIVKLWNEKTKTTEFKPTTVPDIWEFDLPDREYYTWEKILWIELGRINPQDLTMQGVKFNFKYIGDMQEEYEDIVYATGIWAKMTEVLHDANDPVDPSDDPLNVDRLIPKGWEDIFCYDSDIDKDINGYILNSIKNHGGYGVRPLTDVNPDASIEELKWRNLILIRFAIYPKDIMFIERVKFDISRQIKYKDWVAPQSVTKKIPEFTDWPDHPDLPNDDPLKKNKTTNTWFEPDESIHPTPSNNEAYMYVIDAPGFNHTKYNDLKDWPTIKIGGREIHVGFLRSFNNFREFMRVRIDGVRPCNNTIDGGRCSDNFEWHCVFHLTVDQSNVPFLKRYRTDTETCGNLNFPRFHHNCIGTGNIRWNSLL